ncbi:hypothetical protein [Nocardia spumae]|nr:hypothetical protein [Nocardia spumae]
MTPVHPGNTGGVPVDDLLIPAATIILAARSQRLAAEPRPTVNIVA